jgi:carbonic anhydrase/acetyltransferase-like protein (isoleucine patch superfamily)
VIAAGHLQATPQNGSVHDLFISTFVASPGRFPADIGALCLWDVVGQTEVLVREVLAELPDGFRRSGQVAVHDTAVVADSAALTGPVIISARCQIGPGALLRAGTWLDEDVTIGPHSEVKASLIFARSAAAHRNYVGNSIIGQDVNLEAGAVLANHFNERADKRIFARVNGRAVPTGLTKFGAILGDGHGSEPTPSPPPVRCCRRAVSSRALALSIS